ncbi:MAG: protein kinase [Archangiaceae bacterium]|nr:protein kinase [Archangiaceae bacterium]
MAEAGRLGPYRLLATLGRGGMGEVWEAERDDGRGGRVALKTLTAGSHGSAAVRRLLDEAKLVGALEHPNIVGLIEAGEDDGRCYFAMERLHGLTFAELLRAGRAIDPEAVVAMGVQALAALEHARTRQVVHRDLKPSNLFLTRAGRVKLFDFGIARAALVDSTLTQTGAFRGSLAYASPEHVRGEAQDTRSDLFSLALILHELLTGRRVFDERNEAALIGAVLWAPIAAVHAVVPGVPRPLSDAVGWALERDPAQRPESPLELAEALRRSVGRPWGEPELARWLAGLPLPSPAAAPTASVHFAPLQAAPRRDVAPAPPATASRRGLLLAALAGAALLAVGAGAALHGAPTPAGAGSAAGAAAAKAPSPTRPVPPEAPGPSDPKPETAAAPVLRPQPVKKRAGADGRLPTAWLTVDAKPSWAMVTLDGRALGETPLVRVPVAPGKARLVATRPDGSKQERALTLQPGREERVLLLW